MGIKKLRVSKPILNFWEFFLSHEYFFQVLNAYEQKMEDFLKNVLKVSKSKSNQAPFDSHQVLNN